MVHIWFENRKLIKIFKIISNLNNKNLLKLSYPLLSYFVDKKDYNNVEDQNLLSNFLSGRKIVH